MKFDVKSYVRASASGALDFLRYSPRAFVLPSITVYPIDACNYDCVMCPSRMSNSRAYIKMELSMMEQIAEECASMLIKPRLHFSGLGEPLLYSEIRHAMRICNEKGLKWSMTTNGLLLKKYAQDLVINNCNGINLSIHGDVEEHEKITGVNGSLDVVVRGLQELVEQKEKHNQDHLEEN